MLILLFPTSRHLLLLMMAAGFAAAAVIALLYLVVEDQNWNARIFLLLTAAGTFGNLVDSVLGAVFERKGQISNNMVNFLNTLAAALAVGAAERMAYLLHI